MKIAFTHNRKNSTSIEEAEFDTPETIDTIKKSLEKLGHEVELVEVSGPPSRTLARLEALFPDLVFNTAEGQYGKYREAFYPGIFEQLGIPFTGSDAYVCNVTLDKKITKILAAEIGIPTPKYKMIEKEDEINSLTLNYPIMVKPNYEGSSKGITQDSIVNNADELRIRARALLKDYPSGILLEEYIDGKDVTVPFIEGVSQKTKGVLPPAEYVFASDLPNRKYNIYDYELKNSYSDHVDVRVPADVSPETMNKLIDYTAKIVDKLGVRDFGRVDYRVNKNDEIYFIEVNALPSLEPGAGIYSAASCAGLITVESVLDAIIQSSVRRNNIMEKKRQKLKPRRVLRVGFTYDEKRIVPKDDPNTDAEAEYDSPKTLQAIRDAIASYGHEVVDLEATVELPSLLPLADVDLVFNVAEGIKGRYRESQVPALLETLGIPYTGSDPTCLAITLDKGIAKSMVKDAGILTPNFASFVTGKEKLPKGIQFPLIVKPVAEGSSKGVVSKSIVHNEEECRKVALEIIQKYKQSAIAEEFLVGREFTVALLGEHRPRVLPPMEIVFNNREDKWPIYAYHHKLQTNHEITYVAPAILDKKLKLELERVARRAFMVLGCSDVARVDLRLDSQGRVNFIECNPLPGLTPGWSDLCIIAESAGIDYRTLIGEIMAPAIKKYRMKVKSYLEKERKPEDNGSGSEQTDKESEA